MTKRRGASILELMASMMMTLVLAGALFTIFTTTHESREFVVGQTDAETQARQPLDRLADHLRNAQQYKFGSTETVNSYKVIAAGTATSVEYYASNDPNDTVRYFLSGTNLRRTVGGVTTTVMGNITAFNLSYFVTSSTGPYNSAGVSPTASPNSPSAAELPLLAVVQMQATILVDGYQRQLNTYIRLRNSPRKIRL
jgi:Tfp pilus assembly protein PilW